MAPESTEEVLRQKRPEKSSTTSPAAGDADKEREINFGGSGGAAEHFKLRDGAEHGIVELEKHYEARPASATKMTTEDKVRVDEMAATMTQILEGNAAANALTQNLLSQLIQLQMQQITDKPSKRAETDTKTDTDTEPNTETNCKPNTVPNTEIYRKNEQAHGGGAG